MLKTATAVLLISLLFGAVYSLVLIVSPQTAANSTLEARTQMKLESVQEQGVAGTIVAETRYLGVFALATSIAAFFILFNGFKKGQKWAWWAFLLVGGIAWIYGVVFNGIEGDRMNLIGNAIGAVIWLIGILLPIKAFFPKKA